jgi:hypothetical protein
VPSFDLLLNQFAYWNQLFPDASKPPHLPARIFEDCPSLPAASRKQCFPAPASVSFDFLLHLLRIADLLQRPPQLLPLVLQPVVNNIVKVELFLLVNGPVFMMLIPSPQYQISVFHHFDVVVDRFEPVYRVDWIVAEAFSTRFQLL